MKRVYLSIIATLLSFTIYAQEDLRVAVFDPTSNGTSVDEGTKMAVREIISSTIVNEGGYTLVERSMLDKVMQEQSFTNSGVVDDSQATEIGKLAGANKVILSVVTLTGGRNMISIKMIDVQTASVDRQKVKIVTSGELLDVIEPMTLSLLDSENTSGEPFTVISHTENNQTKDTKVVSRNKAGNSRGRQEQSTTQNADLPKVRPEDLKPGEGEIVLYLSAGFQPKKEKDKDLPLIVTLNREVIGSGTLSTGFLIRIPNPGHGKHTLKIGTQKIKLEPDEFNFYEFQVYRWNYLGKALYGVSMKERKMIR